METAFGSKIPIYGCTLVEARPRARLGTFQEAESKARLPL